MKELLAFSIIIPTRNRADALAACLRGMATLDYPRSHFQVIVVNDGGAPIPPALVSECRAAVDLHMVTQSHRGPAAARNLGAAHAKHKWLVLTDDDCIPARDWLCRFGEAFQANSDAVLGGETHNGLRDNIYAEASQCLLLFLQDYYQHPGGKHSQLPYFASNNLALSRHVFQASGGFDETMRISEDRDFCARLMTAGYRLKSVPAARVMHFRGLSFRDFWLQHVEYGGGAFDYHQRRLRAGANDLRLEPFGFYAGMMRYPWRYTEREPARLMALIALSQVANAFGFFRALLRARMRSDTVAARNSL